MEHNIVTWDLINSAFVKKVQTQVNVISIFFYIKIYIRYSTQFNTRFKTRIWNRHILNTLRHNLEGRGKRNLPYYGACLILVHTNISFAEHQSEIEYSFYID